MASAPPLDPPTAEPPAAEWVVNSRNPEAEARLTKELGVPVLVAALLAQRGFTDPAEAHTFLNPALDDLGDPNGLPDYAAARDAILGARERKELIYIHGDYDVDGVTSAALFHRFLTRLGCNIHTHVPHRTKEGYGINLDAVSEAERLGAKLFLTCDCGIAAHEQVARAKAGGMAVVVTDHHEIGKDLPAADAVVNPHRSDSAYAFTELSGAGVVFRVCEGLTREIGFPVSKYRDHFLDLAALGTIADVMPLLGENRVIAKFGLARLQKTQKVGLQALMREADVGQRADRPVNARDVGWQLGPRINAVGRIDDAAIALELLIEADEGRAADLAKQLEQVNIVRRAQTEQIADEAEQIVRLHGYHDRSLIVVANQGWHPGIVGIVASRLVERFHRPCFVFSIDADGKTCKGSARSIPKFHLANAIWAHPDLLTGGGHAMAAGCAFPVDRLDEVREVLDAYAAKLLTPEDFRPSVAADMEVSANEATFAAAEAIAQMEPFGCGNPEPVFLARQLSMTHVKQLKTPTHARLMLRQPGSPAYPGIAFGMAEELLELGAGASIDVLFRPEINEYNGDRSLQWRIRQFRPAA